MLDVHCVKQGTPSIHPISGDELRALLRLQREQERKSPFVFASEHHLLRQVLHGRSSARASKRSLASRVIRTCCVMPADTRPPTQDTNARPANLLGTPQHSTHRALHQTITDALYGLPARIVWQPRRGAALRHHESRTISRYFKRHQIEVGLVHRVPPRVLYVSRTRFRGSRGLLNSRWWLSCGKIASRLR